MKKFLKTILVLCFVVAILASVIPTASAADYNKNYFRYLTEAVYESFGKQGFAYGRLTVKTNTWVNNNSGGCPIDAVAYWADDDGIMEEYTPAAIFKLSTRSTAFEFSDLQIIPEGATKLIVYTRIHGTEEYSTQYAVAPLPENSSYSITKEPVMSMVVVSDTHLRSSDTAETNMKFKKMLSDVETLVPDAAGIFINGDIVQSGRDNANTTVPEAEYARFTQYANSTDIPIFIGVGNHDLWPNALRENMKTIFTGVATLPDGTHPTSINYDFYLNGYHFVFVGDDDGDPTYATLNASTLAWLDETLAEGYEVDAPTFIFMHQALTNTVAGTITNLGQEWDGIINAHEVRSVLSKYPQAILFSSHSHYSMDNVYNAYSGGNTFPFNFNTASLGDVSNAGDEAQGYVIHVYDDSVLIQGRDFASGTWKGTAQYAVLYAEGENGGSFTPVIPDTENNVTPKPEQTEGKTTAPSTSAPEASESETTGEAEQSGGCGSSIAVGTVALALAPAALMLKRKKRK